MSRPSSTAIYYRKAFNNAARCLREAKAEMHPSAAATIRLKNPATDEQEDVMAIEEAISWCINRHLPDWSQGTWRMHRCGYRMFIEKFVASNILDPDIAEELNKKMMNVFGLRRGERTKKTSARRRKVATPEHVDQIEAYTKERGSRWGKPLVLWLRAAIATGLRPNEWQTAEIIEDGDRIILVSENFKHNEQRSYAAKREIDITHLSAQNIHFIKEQVDIVQNFIYKDYMEQYYLGCSTLLYRANKKIWPFRKANINLYTGRHQFSANAKADRSVSEKQRAALMGHKTTETSRARYGKARSGAHGLTPQVANENVLDLIIEKEPRVHPSNRPDVKTNVPGRDNG
jgi:integrase